MSKNAQRNVDILMGFLAVLLVAVLLYVGYRVSASAHRLIPISVIAIIAGAIFESWRIADKFSTVLWTALGSIVFSLISFLPRKHESSYDFEHHIEQFPYWFIIIFAILSIAVHGHKVVPKLTEGITLLQSLAIIYWVVDAGFMKNDSFLLKAAMIGGLLFSLFAVFHAFTYATLTRTARLTLSIWSSIIMLVFAVDNIYRTYQNEQIENTADTTHALYIGLQYFLLGVSSMYVVQNAMMLFRFLPGKRQFFNAEYFRELKELKGEHVDRYSEDQVSILHSILCVLFAGTFFALNYHYQLLPRHLATWAVFAVFPGIVIVFNSLTGIKN